MLFDKLHYTKGNKKHGFPATNLKIREWRKRKSKIKIHAAQQKKVYREQQIHTGKFSSFDVANKSDIIHYANSVNIQNFLSFPSFFNVRTRV